MMAPQFTIDRETCCCFDDKDQPIHECPCDGEKPCCLSFPSVMRPGVICEKYEILQVWIFHERLLYEAHEDKAVQRHDAPPLPPPKGYIV
ncbi:MAG: hypothetical protein RL117_1851 [Verrucomicrobiota bacterium]